jgi:hypothetical protein
MKSPLAIVWALNLSNLNHLIITTMLSLTKPLVRIEIHLVEHSNIPVIAVSS